jgi:hypothetical protein
MKSYLVMRLTRPVQVDARFEKFPWVEIPSLNLDHHMGYTPTHFPGVRVKLAYDQDALYAIFKVEDRFVCARKRAYQERVCEDSCVEFFFTPGEDIDQGYFNLEVNCGGTVFFQHQFRRHIAEKPVSIPDFNQLMIAHSLPKIVDQEITESLTWVVEYRLPFAILANYAPLIQPNSAVTWRANFYKCADKCSSPHWLTWSPVDLPTPDFHRPEFFGILIFG